jgi:hypothetical protein
MEFLTLKWLWDRRGAGPRSTDLTYGSGTAANAATPAWDRTAAGIRLVDLKSPSRKPTVDRALALPHRVMIAPCRRENPCRPAGPFDQG